MSCMAGWKTENIEVEDRVDTSPNTYMQRTINALNRGNYEDALEEAKKAVAYSKGELVYQVLLIRVVFTMERYAVCLKYMVKSGLWDKRNDSSLRSDEKKYLRYVYRVCCQKCNIPIPDDLYAGEDAQDKYAGADRKKQEESAVKKKTIKVPKKEQKVFHTKRNLLIYFILMMVFSVLCGISEPKAFGDESFIYKASLVVGGISMLGFMVTLWFAFLRLIYKQATAARLWAVTFNILLIVFLVVVSFSGVALVATPHGISYCVRAIIPTNDDLGLEVIEVEEKPIFDNAQVVHSEQITKEQYQKEIERMAEIKAAKGM